MTTPAKPLPVGIQTFRDLISGGYLYVDKTPWLYQLIRYPKGVYFLSRPRRFGKSLLISTLTEIFNGNRDLFQGLWLHQSDYQWQQHPVIRIDFSQQRPKSATHLEQILTDILREIANSYQITLTATDYQRQFINLIQALATKKQVVILIDEYDKPILDNLNDITEAQHIRDLLKGFYTTIKSTDEYLRFVFLTGVSKFSKVGVFSGLNNLEDLTLQPRYAAMLGITQTELERDFQPHLQDFAQYDGRTPAQLLTEIRAWYNGFCFSAHCEPVYNPFSLLLCLKQQRFAHHWFESGTPTFLIQLLHKNNYDVPLLEQLIANEIDFSTYDIERLQIVPLLFQSGYLTITDYEKDTLTYHLSYPNYEVKHAFLAYLLDAFSQTDLALNRNYLRQLTTALKQANFENFFHTLNTFLANIPYDIQLKQEKYYQTIFYLIFKLIGLEIGAEVRTNRGRIDAVIELDTAVYLFEFKLNHSASDALQQIKQRHYFQSYQTTHTPLHLIGVQFHLQTRTITAWETETIFP